MSILKQFFVLFVCCITTVHSQVLKKETLSSSGSAHFVYAHNKSYYIQESIAQGSVIQTYVAGNYSVRQGFLQPVFAASLTSTLDSTLEGVIFPNPFNTEFTIQFGEPVFDVITVLLYDTLGRLVLRQIFQPTERLIISVGNLATGHYSLKVNMRSEVLYAKLIKR